MRFTHKEQIKCLEEAGPVDIEAKRRAVEELEGLRQLRLKYNLVLKLIPVSLVRGGSCNGS